MNKLFSILILLATVSISPAQINVGAPQVVVSNLLTYVSVNGTNNGSSYYTTLSLNKVPLFQFENSSITNVMGGSYTTNGITNVVRGNIQFSLDGVNFTTLTNWNPSTTNASVETFSPGIYRIPVYIRAQIITSNAISVGAKAIIPP